VLKKRVIFTLLYDNGSFVLSRNFRLQKVGDLNWLKKNYNFSKISFSIDELIILDVTRGERDEDKFNYHVKSLTEECFIPIAAGGGVRNLEQVRKLLLSGADKIVVNTLIEKSTKTIKEIATEFGEQCIVVSVDVRLVDDIFTVWTRNGAHKQSDDLNSWLKKINNLPIGELYLNSIDKDGTGQGYEYSLLNNIPKNFNTPMILAGGAGKYEHICKVISDNRVDAVATAHLFNFIGDGLSKIRIKLQSNGYKLPYWETEYLKELRGGKNERKN